MYSQAVLLERLQRALLRGLLVCGAAWLAVFIRHFSTTSIPWRTYVVPNIVVAVIFAGFAWSRPSPWKPRPRWQVLEVSLVAALAVLAVSFFQREDTYSRATFAIFFPLAILAVYSGGRLSDAVSTRLRSHVAASRRVLIVGHGAPARRLAFSLKGQPAFYRLVGVVVPKDVPVAGAVAGAPVIGTIEDLESLAADHQVDEVIIAESSSNPIELMELIGRCMKARLSWKVLTPLLGMRDDRVSIDLLDGIPLIGPRGSRLVGHNWILKRALDITIAGIALLVALPLLALIAMAIRLTSPGPAVFRQERVGFHGRRFELLKFRSMRVDSSPDIHLAYADQWIHGRSGNGGSEGAQLHKLELDPRITPVGRFIRKTSLDELPQLINVLQGHMSLVGPRPPLPYEVERYTEWHKRRLDVPPGLTGLWQISGRNNISFDQMVALDLAYIEQWSLLRDIEILLKTVPALVASKGH